MPSFRHSGKLGDVIYSLPSIRAMGGGVLYLNSGGAYGMDEQKVQALLPLLEVQPYIEAASCWNGEPYDYDLDAFRAFGPRDKNLADCHLEALGQDRAERNEAWLEVSGGCSERENAILLSRSLGHRGTPGFWEMIYEVSSTLAVLVGSEQEHRAFCNEIGAIPHADTFDLLEAAGMISNATLFVGNQSCPLAIAEGLKVPVILEVDPNAPNCTFVRPNVLAVVDSASLAEAEKRVSKVLRARSQPSNTDPVPNRSAKAKRRGPSETSRVPASNYVDFVLQCLTPAAKRVLVVGLSQLHVIDALQTAHRDVEIWAAVERPDDIKRTNIPLSHVFVGRTERLLPLPMPPGSTDAIILGDSLTSMSDPLSWLRSVTVALAANASVVCSVDNPSHWRTVLNRLGDRGADWSNPCRPPPYSPGEIRGLLWEAGLVPHRRYDEGQPDHAAVSTFLPATTSLGIPEDIAEMSLRAGKVHLAARPAPDPQTDLDAREKLLGPHRGALGDATKRFSVVILTFNSSSTIGACLDSVLPTLGAEDELILVDNASTDDTMAALESVQASKSNVRLIQNAENFGFSRGCNVGLLASKGEFLVLLNPDTQVWPGWLEGMVGRFRESSVGAVGPVCDRVSGQQFVRFHIPGDRQPKSLDSLAQEVRTMNSGRTSMTKLLVGFCLMLRRELLDQIGLLDEQMFLGSEDLELSWRLRTLGYNLAIAADVFVHHETGVSFRTLRAFEADRVRARSDRALLKRLYTYYGRDAIIESVSVWGNDIFKPILQRR